MVKPRGKVYRYTTPKKGLGTSIEPQLEIAVWCPDPEAKMPPEQVHFIIHMPTSTGLAPLVLRFKSPDTLGFFIEELTKYRREVWPNCELVKGDKHG